MASSSSSSKGVGQAATPLARTRPRAPSDDVAVVQMQEFPSAASKYAADDLHLERDSFPLEQESDSQTKRCKTFPAVCTAIILACVACCLVEIARNEWKVQPLSCPASCGAMPCNQDGTPCEPNPMLGPTALVLETLGAKSEEAIFQRGEWWRLITCNWLHAGVFHLLVNMLAVANLGFPLERKFGHVRVAIIYFVSGLFGAMLSVVFLPDVLSVGASGCVFGLFGAVWADVILNRIATGRIRNANIISLFIFTVVNVALGLTPFIDNFMHMGGLVAGFILGLVLFTRKHQNERTGNDEYNRCQLLLVFVGIILFLTVIGLILLVTLDRNVLETLRSCEFCHLVNCVEVSFFTTTPWWSCCMERPTSCKLDFSTALIEAYCNSTSGRTLQGSCNPLDENCSYDSSDASSTMALCARLCTVCG